MEDVFRVEYESVPPVSPVYEGYASSDLGPWLFYRLQDCGRGRWHVGPEVRARV